MKRILSWNVNGIRALEKKGFVSWLLKESPDILAIQETKAHSNQLSNKLLNVPGYKSYFFSADRKGYSGTALYSKDEPLSIEQLGIDEFDAEGRVLIAHYESYAIVNCYFPNSQHEGARLDYKLSFCNAILDKCEDLISNNDNVIVCGDYNIAHKPIDLKNPRANEKNPGYLPEERAWMDKFLSKGYCDIFRLQHPEEEDHYSWWSYRFSARERNIGWRIDYLCVNEAFVERCGTAEILSDVTGSDHCPVALTVNPK